MGGYSPSVFKESYYRPSIQKQSHSALQIQNFGVPRPFRSTRYTEKPMTPVQTLQPLSTRNKNFYPTSTYPGTPITSQAIAKLHTVHALRIPLHSSSICQSQNYAPDLTVRFLGLLDDALPLQLFACACPTMRYHHLALAWEALAWDFPMTR